MKKQSKLATLRTKISAIDTKLMKLLDERLKLSNEVGAFKRLHELPVEDPHVEMKKRRERTAYLSKTAKANVRDIEAVFRSIIQVSRAVQRRGADQIADKKVSAAQSSTRVAVMGSRGSFSEAAAIEYCERNKIKNAELMYPVSAEGVLHLLEVEKADIGIFPIHNSIGGIVEESIYAASEHNFFIEDIFGFEVRQCLLALPGVKMSDIKVIMSHPQALAQCKTYLKTQFPHAELIEASDTATSAKYLGTTRNRTDLAVIAPGGCAKLYNLQLLAEGIQDQKKNTTHFIAALM